MFWHEILRAKGRARSWHVAPFITYILNFLDLVPFGNKPFMYAQFWLVQNSTYTRRCRTLVLR
jgi:hypothetical protein